MRRLALDVFPAFAGDDTPNAAARDTIFPSKVGLPFALIVAAAYILYACLRKFCKAALRASNSITNVAGPALRHSVMNVIRLRASKKVARIHAWRIIASMKREKVVQLGIVQFIRNAMRKQSLVIVEKAAVPVAVDRALPNPTVIVASLRDLRPELTCNAAELLNTTLFDKGHITLFACLFSPFFHADDNGILGLRKQQKEFSHAS